MTRVSIDPWKPAVEHLIQADGRWQPHIERIGPCGLRPRRDRFGSLVRAVVSQQISTKAAQSISARLLDTLGGTFTAEGLLEAGETAIQAAGVSRGKYRTLMELSEAVAAGKLPLQRIGKWSDQEIINRLTQVWGVGVWTAQMFLIFVLNRPDILPATDLGIRAGLRDHFELYDLPTVRVCEQLCEPWQPYRTVAMWYLWRCRDNR